jgi:hypothetical protein
MPILVVTRGRRAFVVRYSGLSGEVSAPKSGQRLNKCDGHGSRYWYPLVVSVGGPNTGIVGRARGRSGRVYRSATRAEWKRATKKYEEETLDTTAAEQTKG